MCAQEERDLGITFKPKLNPNSARMLRTVPTNFACRHMQLARKYMALTCLHHNRFFFLRKSIIDNHNLCFFCVKLEGKVCSNNL
jgi:hypothetical protein